ncbi:hypothetical protein B0T25DRAFT_569811 [Lasiosphaeria hispida]|uniref:Uncharacterized protein n=1 Tax=Lasiosphaeria hispida TaxID=260671 RepID=A0AAJ0HE39_9PEZI|nr:hypothetical protein B0T25DRAFT_569811 [Lasiosphaeria hispida]
MDTPLRETGRHPLSSYSERKIEPGHNFWGYEVRRNMNSCSWTKLPFDRSAETAEFDGPSLQVVGGPAFFRLPPGKDIKMVCQGFLTEVYRFFVVNKRSVQPTSAYRWEIAKLLGKWGEGVKVVKGSASTGPKVPIPTRSSSKRAASLSPSLVIKQEHSRLVSEIKVARKKLKPSSSFDSDFWSSRADLLNTDSKRVELFGSLQFHKYQEEGGELSRQRWEDVD